MSGLGAAKKHRAKKSGVKADKKVANKKKKLGQSNEKHNPRAFSVSGIVKTKRTQQRNLDKAQKKEVVPLVNRLASTDYPPPVLVVIMGPKQCGKSTLIRSLVKIFTGQNLSSTTGPITCVAGRQRRVTFFECPTDLYSMTDLSKVADLVLLLVDASYGFEMETFEFLNQLQLHGFPKVVGVLTHLDGFKANKTLQKTKKALKQRFWTEIYDGAKMFDLSGVINGKYPKHEVKRLSLYISRTKFRPLVWRNTHPYVVCDRVEDVTPQQKIQEAAAAGAECDREVMLYGYVRGTHLRQQHRVHLIGVGDFDIAAVASLDDPCHQPGGAAQPLPSGDADGKGKPQQQQQQLATLKKKDNLLYAPMANVGRVKIDSGGVYIELKTVHYTKKENLLLGDQQAAGDDDDDEGGRLGGGASSATTPADLLRRMQDTSFSLDERMHGAEMSLFAGSTAVRSDDVDVSQARDEYDDEEEEEEGDSDEDDDDEEEESGEDEEEGDEDEDEDEEGRVRSDTQWKSGMRERAAASYEERSSRRSQLGGRSSSADVMRLVYGSGWSVGNLARGEEHEALGWDGGDGGDDDDDDGDLFVPVRSTARDEAYRSSNSADSSRHRLLRVFGYGSAASVLAVAGGTQSQPAAASSSSSRAAKSSGTDAGTDAGAVDFSTMRLRFVTGGEEAWRRGGSGGDSGGGSGVAGGGEGESWAEGSDEEYGDFEDLQEQAAAARVVKGTGNTGGDDDDDDDDDEGEEDDEEEEEEEEDEDEDGDSVDSEAANDDIDAQLRETHARKKSQTKSTFDADYDHGKVGKVRGVQGAGWRCRG